MIVDDDAVYSDYLLVVIYLIFDVKTYLVYSAFDFVFERNLPHVYLQLEMFI